MAIRTKILALLLGLLLFMTVAIGAALGTRARASQALARVTARDVPLLTIAVGVNDAYHEQAVLLERAIRHADDRHRSADAQAAYAAARDEHAARAATIWSQLQEARGLAKDAVRAQDPGAETMTRQIARLDAAHNAYAARVREAFALLDAGERGRAVAAAHQAVALEDGLETALGALLASAGAAADDAANAARRDERVAWWVGGSLLAAGIALATWVFAAVIRLVSEVRELSGLLPICSSCKSIRDDQGYWTQLEGYLEAHSKAAFTHGLCTHCKDDLIARTVREPQPAPASP